MTRSVITFGLSFNRPSRHALWVYSMMLMTGRGLLFRHKRSDRKTLAVREAWPHSPIRSLLRLQALCFRVDLLHHVFQYLVAVEEAVIDAVEITGADGPAIAGRAKHRGIAHQRVGLHDVVRNGREKEVFRALFIDRKVNIYARCPL